MKSLLSAGTLTLLAFVILAAPPGNLPNLPSPEGLPPGDTITIASLNLDHESNFEKVLRDVEAALGDGVKRGPSEEEQVEMYAKARRSVVAACDIPSGTRITRDMLTIKRPGHGIAPKLIDALVGRTAAVDIEDDDVLTWDML